MTWIEEQQNKSLKDFETQKNRIFSLLDEQIIASIKRVAPFPKPPTDLYIKNKIK